MGFTQTGHVCHHGVGEGTTTTQYCCGSHPGSSVEGLDALGLYPAPFALLAHPREKKLGEGESSSSKLECEFVFPHAPEASKARVMGA